MRALLKSVLLAVFSVAGLAHGWASSAVIAAEGSELVVCPAWSGTGGGCLGPGPWPTISAGGSTAGVVADADGYWLPAGCSDGSRSGPGWVQVHGRFGRTVTVNLDCP